MFRLWVVVCFRKLDMKCFFKAGFEYLGPNKMATELSNQCVCVRARACARVRACVCVRDVGKEWLVLCICAHSIWSPTLTTPGTDLCVCVYVYE